MAVAKHTRYCATCTLQAALQGNGGGSFEAWHGRLQLSNTSTFTVTVACLTLTSRTMAVFVHQPLV